MWAAAGGLWFLAKSRVFKVPVLNGRRVVQ